jgi:hypothetical protein
MSRNVVLALAEDTLFERRMSNSAGCFTHNVAGGELVRESDGSLPFIEDFLRTVVVPAFGCRKLPGLTYVLGAYLVIGVRADPQRAFSFIRALPTPLRVSALGVVDTFFHYGPSGTNSLRSPPTGELLKFLEHESASELPSVRWAAEHVLKRLGK